MLQDASFCHGIAERTPKAEAQHPPKHLQVLPTDRHETGNRWSADFTSHTAVQLWNLKMDLWKTGCLQLHQWFSCSMFIFQDLQGVIKLLLQGVTCVPLLVANGG